MGFLLLVFQGDGRKKSYEINTTVPWRTISISVATLMVALLAAALAFRNGPAILHLNFHPLERYGVVALESLPAGGGVVLSDRSETLQVFQMALAHSGRKDCVAVDTRQLPAVDYRARLERRYPMGWLNATNKHDLDSSEVVQLLEGVARNHRLFYLHPSYGPIFERFYAEPTGSILELKPRGKELLNVPALADNASQAAEQFWTTQWNRELSVLVPEPNSSLLQRKLGKIGLTPVPREADKVLADWYAVQLDGWAVRLQQQGRLREAQTRLEQVIQLNSNNVSSRVTLVCNTNVQAGAKLGLRDVAKLVDQMGSSERITNILSNFGPVDEPDLDFLIGSTFYKRKLLVQAAEYLERVHVLVPGNIAPELALGEIYGELWMPERSLSLVQHIRQEMHGTITNQAVEMNLAFLESNAWLMQTNRTQALAALQKVANKFSTDSKVQNRLLSAFLSLKDFTNALEIVSTQLTDSPNDVSRLNLKSALLIEMGQPAEALPVLDHILMLTNLPDARVNRAMAQLSMENFALAKVDLNELRRMGVQTPLVDFELGIEAEHESDTNSARGYFQSCMDKVPPHEALWEKANARLTALESPPAK